MERTKLYKSIASSIFWIFVTLAVSWFLYEYAMSLMSKSSTLYFVCGVSLVVIDIMFFFFMMDYQAFKIKRAYKKNTEQKEDVSNKENTTENDKKGI